MSKKNTEKVLLDFLKNKDPQVVALKGTWGSGKTYFWNTFLLENKNEGNCNFKKYSYCSLFGLKSGEDIRRVIYQNGVDKKDIGKDIIFRLNSPESWYKFGKSFNSIAKEAPIIKDWNPGNAIFQTVGALGFLNPKEYLICIDDFERASVNPEETLGIISELKEQRGCKVLFIFNDSGLSKEHAEVYKKFKEKVIDVEISFAPTPEECGDVIFKNHSKSTEPDHLLYKLCVQLGVTNIRILKKIKDIKDIIFPHLSTYDSGLVEQILSTLSLFTYAYYGNPSGDTTSEIPNIEYISNFSPYGDFGKEIKIEHEQKWKQTLSLFGWTGADNLDIEVLKIINRGYVIEQDLKEIANESDKAFRAGNVEKQYSDIWKNIFHIGFIDNESEFIENMIGIFSKFAEYLDIPRLNHVIGVFRDLGKEDEAQKIIELYIEGNKGKENKFNIHEHHFSKPIDVDIGNRFMKIYNSYKGITTLPQVLDSIVARNYSYGKVEEDIIFSKTEDDFFNLFNGLTGDKLHAYMRILLRFKDTPSSESQWYRVAQDTINALKKFGNSKYNNARLKSYGILLDE